MPLKFSLDDFESLAQLSEPMRTRAELVKLSIMLARLAVNQWESWDLTPAPASRTLERLGVADLGQLLRQTRSDLNKITEFHPGRADANVDLPQPQALAPVAYCNLSSQRCDLLVELLGAVGLAPRECSIEELRTSTGPVVVNALGAAQARLVGRDAARPGVVVVTDADKAPLYAQAARVATLPCSFGRLREALAGLGEAEGAAPVDSLLACEA
jgi:hypothetical protein